MGSLVDVNLPTFTPIPTHKKNTPIYVYTPRFVVWFWRPWFRRHVPFGFCCAVLCICFQNGHFQGVLNTVFLNLVYVRAVPCVTFTGWLGQDIHATYSWMLICGSYFSAVHDGVSFDISCTWCGSLAYRMEGHHDRASLLQPRLRPCKPRYMLCIVAKTTIYVSLHWRVCFGDLQCYCAPSCPVCHH